MNDERDYLKWYYAYLIPAFSVVWSVLICKWWFG